MSRQERFKLSVAPQMLSSDYDAWTTPRPLFETLDSIFGFRLDPCCERKTAKCMTYFTRQDDGLVQDWASVGNAFVNPPYGKALPAWMNKCVREAAKRVTVVALIPARTETAYWHDIVFPFATCVCFVRGRVKFGDSKSPDGGRVGAPFPSAIITFGPCTTDQARRLGQLGKVYDSRELHRARRAA